MSSGYTTKLDYKPAPPGFGKPLAPGTPLRPGITNDMVRYADDPIFSNPPPSSGTPATPFKSNNPNTLTSATGVSAPRLTPAPGVSVQPGGKKRKRRNTKKRKGKKRINSRKYKSRRMR